ncbi:MAG: hypothetical protein H7Y11_14780 [Armatimonadetes bacterium]|nr:hypothetical protein [Anaerolineae bacterium]
MLKYIRRLLMFLFMLIRRVVIFLAMLTLIVYIGVLLNFTDSNPTGRRYSSAMPLTSGQGDSQEIGASGVAILARDLNLPLNDAPDQLQCVCGSGYTTALPNKQCRLCVSSTPLLSRGNYRRPDFVTRDFIAESKNVQQLVYESRDFEQIQDYATAARALGRPLWLYVRVNTQVDLRFTFLVIDTGGGIVRYFSVPGWEDGVDREAKHAIAISGGVLSGTLILEALSRRSRKPRTPKTPRTPKHPALAANNKLNEAEALKDRATDRARIIIEREE